MAGKQATSVAAGAENPWKKKSFANLFHSNEPAAAAPTVKPIQTYKKEPTLILEEEDIFSLAVPFNCSLIEKFSHGKPSMETPR